MAAESSFTFGIDLLEQDIDNVIFRTNEFLMSGSGTSGPFWWILQISMALAALFSIIFAANLAFKMMTKNEPLDVMKLFRPLAISLVLCFWYPANNTALNGIVSRHNSFCILDGLAWLPNAFGSYTHDLYSAEAIIVQDKFKEMELLMDERDQQFTENAAKTEAAKEGMNSEGVQSAAKNGGSSQDFLEEQVLTMKLAIQTLTAGLNIGIDKLIMFLSLIMFRIGWWSTIYGQQILLGMLTIFGPIQWAFSILPKWEGAWAKWITRYMTVHLYGAALYFIGFYVLLLFDIVLSIQLENLTAITASDAAVKGYMMNSFLTSGYMVVASIVSLKCLNFVPDIAAWILPEGETTFSTRSFGEGVASQVKSAATGVAGKALAAI